MARYAVVILLTLSLVVPVDISGPFNSAAVIDASQVIVTPGVWMCPEGEQDDEANCTVDLVPVVPNRPDWDEALAACMQYYSPNDCYNSVSNGEF